jgi:hypothetical protein
VTAAAEAAAPKENKKPRGYKANASKQEPISLQPFLNLYEELGIAVLPAVYGEKRPSVEWKKFQEGGPEKSQIKEWFNDGKQHNIAVLCGAPSVNLVVLDFDDVAVYPKFFDVSKLERETLVVRTGSGKIHVYLRIHEPVASFKIPQLKLEVRSDGNVVIAPPSKHPSGGYYEFVNKDVKQFIEVTDLVGAVWKKAEELGVKTPTHLFKGRSDFQLKFELPKNFKPLSNREEEKVVEFLCRHWKPGNRNQLEMYFLGFALKKGVAYESAWRIIEEVCKRTNDEERQSRLALVDYHYRSRPNATLKGKAGIRELLGVLKNGNQQGT